MSAPHPIHWLLLLAGIVAPSGCGPAHIVTEPVLQVTATASSTDGVVPLTVTFGVTSASPLVEPVHYQWQLEADVTASVAAPTHTYLASGQHRVTVTVEDGRGVRGDAAVTVQVGPATPATLTVTPVPQQLYVGTETLALTGTWTVVVDAALENSASTAERVRAALASHTDVAVSVADADSFFATHGEPDTHPSKTVYLMLYGDERIQAYFARLGESIADVDRQIGSLGFGQGYVAFDHNGSLFVLASSAAGVFYGAVTLEALLTQVETSLPRLVVIDYPDLERRIYYPVGHEDSAHLADPAIGLALIETLARAKLNGVHLSSGSMTSHVSNMFAPYIRAAQERFIRPILGPALPLDIACAAEGFRVLDEPFVISGGVAQPTRPDNPGFANLDFETGVPGQTPSGWSVMDTSASKGEWLLTTAAPGDGSMSAVLHRDDTHIDARPMLYQTVAIPPGTWAMAEFDARTDGTSGDGYYQFLLAALNAAGERLFYRAAQVTPTQDGVWLTFPVTLSQHPEATQMMLWVRPTSALRGTLYVSEIRLARMNAALANVLLGYGHTFRVTDATGTLDYVEGADYTLDATGSPPTTASAIESLGYHLSLQRVPTGAMPANASLLLSYDYLYKQDKSTPHNQSPFVDCGYSQATAYFATLATLLTAQGLDTDAVDIFLGQDEIRGFNMDARAMAANQDNATALTLHLRKLVATARASFPSARVYLWGDMLDPHHNGGDEMYQASWGGKPGITMPATFQLDSNIDIIPWWYDNKDAFKVMRESVGFFNRAGLRVAGGAGGNLANAQYWSSMLHGTGNDFYGHSIFETTLSKADAAAVFGAHAWHTYRGSVAAIALDGSFELCNGLDDDGDGLIDEDYDLTDDADHCGACDQPCALPHGWGRCVMSACQVAGCVPDYSDVNGDWHDGCESGPP